MPDFFQNQLITTLHELGAVDLVELESMLQEWQLFTEAVNLVASSDGG